ncbi:MAG: hypothetical protein ACYC3G_01780 [Minisyncoccota bacterium]
MNSQTPIQNIPKANISLKEKLQYSWGKFVKLLKSEAIIGSVSISNTAIRFVRLNDGIIEKIGVVLEPGIIASGKLKNRELLLKALLALRYKLGNPKGSIHVMVSLPPDNVYTQSFSIPVIEDRLINEAAKLNLQLLSPIDIKTAYTDWEKIGVSQEEGGKIELLGGFTNKAMVDEFTSVFREAGFGIVAVEFSALSLARLIKTESINSNFEKPQVFLSVSSDGPEFLIIKNNKLYFNYFFPWTSVEGRQISFSDFGNILSQEMKKVLNFYSSHWNSQLNDLILITQGLYSEIEGIIKQNFPTINIKPLTLNEAFSNFNSSWYPALGGAIRGKISRSEDNFISLMDIGTEQSFFESRVDYFVKIWRTIILSTSSIIVFCFFLANMFFLNISNGLENQISVMVQRQESQEVLDLEKKANEFNDLIAKALYAKKNSRQVSKFFNVFSQIAGNDVAIQKIVFDSDRATVLITAIAKSNQAVINFKNSLASLKEFRNVEFSFTSTTSNTDGTINFPITFGVNI